MPTETKHLVSIGHLCQQFQKSYFALLQRLTELGVKPEMTLNLVPYFDFQQACIALEQDPPMIRGDGHAD